MLLLARGETTSVAPWLRRYRVSGHENSERRESSVRARSIHRARGGEFSEELTDAVSEPEQGHLSEYDGYELEVRTNGSEER
jgi:hypothetical protein